MNARYDLLSLRQRSWSWWAWHC